MKFSTALLVVPFVFSCVTAHVVPQARNASDPKEHHHHHHHHHHHDKQPQGMMTPQNDLNHQGRGNNNAQTSLTLNKKVICPGFAQNGLNASEPGQVASATSTNNFINSCLLTLNQFNLTNGQQNHAGSCNPAPMGMIPAINNIPRARILSPTMLQNLPPNQNFTITIGVNKMQTGFFVNAANNYYAAPIQLNSQGLIQGHSHVVVQAVNNIDSTEDLDPTKFAFFKGLNNAAVNGQLSAVVGGGLQPGVYRLCSITTAANHQAVAPPIAQRGSVDDCLHFTVGDQGQQDTNDFCSKVSNKNTPQPAAANVNTSTTTSTTSSTSSTSSASSTSTSTMHHHHTN